MGSISDLPLPLYNHILSFLPTKFAATTSVLSKEWRHVFESSLSLKFEYNFEGDVTVFTEFVDRVFASRGFTPLRSLRLFLNEDVDGVRADAWIQYALDNGVSILEFDILGLDDWWGPPQNLFLHEPLVSLKIGTGRKCIIDEDCDVNLPNLKTLHLHDVRFESGGAGFVKLLSGCPVLEELTMTDEKWYNWETCCVSHKALKTLKFAWETYPNRKKFSESVSLDTPKLVSLDYMDCVARDYPILNLESLVEAKIHLQRTEGDDSEENDSATFLKGICHVQNLYLHSNTLEVLTFCCSEIPQFVNLSNLEIKNHPTVEWDSLPNLLTNCPNLETLTFRGLVHSATESCGDLCLCNGLEIIPSCLSTSPVKVLKIYECGEANKDAETFLKQVTHFLMTMPHLKQLLIYSPDSSDVVVKNLEMISGKASLVCKIQVLPS